MARRRYPGLPQAGGEATYLPGTPYQDDIHVRRQRGGRMAVALAYHHAVEVEVRGVASQSLEQAEVVKCHR